MMMATMTGDDGKCLKMQRGPHNIFRPSLQTVGLEFNTAAGTVEHDDDGNGRDSKDDGSVEQFDKVAPKMICCQG